MDQVKISEKTLVPLSLVFVFLGGIVWLTTLYSETKANGSDIIEIKNSQKEYSDKLERILEKVIRIEGMLRKGDRE